MTHPLRGTLKQPFWDFVLPTRQTSTHICTKIFIFVLVFLVRFVSVRAFACSHYYYVYLYLTNAPCHDHPTSKKYMLSKKWSHRNSKVSSHQANQMFVCALIRIHIRVHTPHTFSVFSKLEVSKWSRFSSQSNVTHIHTCPRTYTRPMSKNTEAHRSTVLMRPFGSAF